MLANYPIRILWRYSVQIQAMKHKRGQVGVNPNFSPIFGFTPLMLQSVFLWRQRQSPTIMRFLPFPAPHVAVFRVGRGKVCSLNRKRSSDDTWAFSKPD